jgi:hypothetical protein
MRFLLGLICIFALGVVPLVGCSETAGDGGTGGSAGSGGMGGTAGMPECAEDCDDGNDCTEDVCDPADESCSTATPVADGTSCAGGTCQSGACVLSGSVLPCTEQGIRNAIAAGGGPYTFDCDGPTTVVTEAEIDIYNSVILDGEGNLTVDGPDEYSTFRINNRYPMIAELRGFSLTGACHGVFVGSGGNFALVDSVLSGNSAARCVGIRNDGRATLTNCTVSGNGIGVLNWYGSMTVTESNVFGNTDRGIRVGGGTILLINSTVSGNKGGGIALYPAYNWVASATVMNSTVSGNIVTSGRGGGIYVGWPATLTLTNSTVSNNSAPQDSGGGIFNADTVKLIGATVSGNTAADGSGIHNSANISATVTMTIQDTLVEGACGGPGAVVSEAHNIESPGDTCGFSRSTDHVNINAEDLKLEPLQDNGGPTETHALGAGSIAIDVIPGDLCEADKDQRGRPRPETDGGMCDVGAFEVQP